MNNWDIIALQTEKIVKKEDKLFQIIMIIGRVVSLL